MAMNSGAVEPNVCKGAFINYISNLGVGGLEKWLLLLINDSIFAYYVGSRVKKSPKISLRSS